MKKLICVILAALLLTACGAEPAAPTTEETKFDPTAQILGETVEFAPWEQEGLPTEGSYYLTEDVVLTRPVTVTGDLKLHLNSHKVTMADEIFTNIFVIPAGTAMTVYDAPLTEDPFAKYDWEDENPQQFTVNTGAIVSARSFAGRMTVSSMFRVEGELVIAGGHLDGSQIAIDDSNNGSVIHVQDGGKVTIDGGVITGGASWRLVVPETVDVENTTTETTEPQPEVVSETFGCGGAIYVGEGGKATVSGGTIYGGSACEGGNIYVAEQGELNITGGRLLAGESTKQGGNVCVAGTMNMSGGSLDWGESYCDGGNVFLSGTLNMTGGTMQGGVCDINALGFRYGGNLAVDGIRAKVKISGAQLLDGRAACKESNGGNISVIRYGAEEFEVGEGAYIYGGFGHRGGNVYIGHLVEDIPAENMDYVFTGMEMGGGMTTYRGANLCTHTIDVTKPIVVTFNDCTLHAGGAEPTMAIGAGSKQITEAIITINGGLIDGGELNVYGHATVTANGVELVNTLIGGPGKFIENP